MKKHVRKIALLVMVITLVTSVIAPLSVSAATPRLNNTMMTHENFIIEDGVAIISLGYTGYENVTRGANITITLQRKNLFWWKEVSMWAVGLNGWTNSTTETMDLSKTGEYRVIIEYEISGSGGADDVFSVTLYDEY